MADGLNYLHHHDSYSFVSSTSVIVIFAACGFCGVSCVAALTKRFGALVAAITTTARKALTLLLSFIVFPKPFVFGHLLGVVLFTSGIFLKSTATKMQQPHHAPPGMPSTAVGGLQPAAIPRPSGRGAETGGSK